VVSRDIIVVGAGVIGCAVAYELARRGAAVELVDERPPGQGATQASAGILAPYLEVREPSPLLGLTTRSLDQYDDFVAAVRADGAAAFEYQRTGTIDIALDAAELDRLKHTVEVAATHGIHAELIDGAAARRLEPHLTDDVIGALVISIQGFITAEAFTQALAKAAVRHGARIAEPCRVRRIATAASHVIVETDRGARHAHSVIVAAGCWSGGIYIDGASVTVPVRPVRGQLLHLAWNGPILRRVTWGGRCYLVPWDDGTLLVGATVEEAGFDDRATVAGVRDLLEAACDLVPRAWTAAFKAVRVGLRPGTPDALPVIGPSQRDARVVYATGHYRNGVLLAPVTARLVADVVLNKHIDPLLEAVSPRRFGL
jgi:glycine oxidase